MVNGLFGKLLDLASDKVILQLIKANCTSVLLYGLECFYLNIGHHTTQRTYNYYKEYSIGLQGWYQA